MRVIVPLVVFLLGTAIGSFLSALLWRLRTGESFVLARSYCPHCKQTLGWLDLLPLASYALLGGKCRYCRQGISWQYPVLEMTVGLLFLAAYALYGADALTGQTAALLLRDWLAIAVFVAVFVFDFRYSLIPRALVLPTSLVVLFLGFLGGDQLSSFFLGVGVTAGFFALQYAVSRGRWIGMGDVTFGIFIGSALGFSRSLVALFIAYIFGAIFACMMLATRRLRWKSEIPFGTFLAVGSTIALLCGERIVQWYLAFL